MLIVFVFHYGGGTHSSFKPLRFFGLLNKGGWCGVVLFFVLSGFLITGILWDSYEDPHWWRKFFARRSLRILPLYFLTLLLVILAAIPHGSARSVLTHIWIPALFLENIPHLAQISETLKSPLAIFHLWSIAVEEQFYLLWPFLLLLTRTRERAKLLCQVTFVVSFVFRIMLWTLYPEAELFSHFLLTQAGALSAGGWLAISYRGPEWTRILRWAPLAAVAGAAGFLLCGLVSHDFESSGRYMTTLGLPAITLLFAAVLSLSLEPGLLATFFSMPWLRALGNISYGVYVFHMLLVNVYAVVTDRLAAGRGQMVYLVSRFVVAGVLSLLAAVVSYHLFEKPFLRLKKYFTPEQVRRSHRPQRPLESSSGSL